MKELSIEEKAKCYDEAIERAIRNLNGYIAQKANMPDESKANILDSFYPFRNEILNTLEQLLKKKK